jgi:hypothetical protein
VNAEAATAVVTLKDASGAVLVNRAQGPTTACTKTIQSGPGQP